jgi:hypothetical protein
MPSALHGGVRFLGRPRNGAEETVRRLRRGEPILFVDARRDAPRITPAGYAAVAYCTTPGPMPETEILFVHVDGDVRVLEGGALACGRADGAPGGTAPRR